MSNLNLEILKKINKTQLQGLPVSRDILYPLYKGYSLSNIPATICRFLDIPEFGEESFPHETVSLISGPYKHVILLVVDALGYQLLNKLMDEGHADFWKNNLKNGVYFPLTSICPSTTASALTTLWTGVSPATHGIIGYEMWSKEFGMVINNILHNPMSFSGDVGGLIRAGFDPKKFLNMPTFGSHLLKHNIQARALMHYSIGTSGLSSMHLSDVDLHSYVSESDLWVTLKNLLNNAPQQKSYTYAYWSIVDTLTHRFSLNDQRIALQFSDFSNLIKNAFLDGLIPSIKKDTLLILTADHGSIYTPQNSHYDLVQHAELLSMLRIQPTCENRLVFLFTKSGQEQVVRDYFNHQWPGQFTLIDRQIAIDANLFGEKLQHPMLNERVGDLIAIAHGNAYIWWANKTNVMLGRHGGLSPEEMLIPFLALPL